MKIDNNYLKRKCLIKQNNTDICVLITPYFIVNTILNLI